MSAEYPSRIGVGDGEGWPCRFVAVDFARSDETAAVSGHRDADGILHLDRAGTERPPMVELNEHFSRLRTSADFLVDVTAPPNGCERCGTLERDHATDHSYVTPADALRLARMKTRREARLNPAPRPALLPEVFATFTADTSRLAEAMLRIGETITRSMQPVFAQIRSVAFTLSGAPVEANWAAEGSVCAHVCGPDPGHVCDARATTTIRHALPSGGTRTLPLCGPCHAAETGDTVRDNPGTGNRETADRTGRA